MKTALVLVLSLLLALAGVAAAISLLGEPLRPWKKNLHQQNYLQGQAASAYFGVVPASSLSSAVRAGHSDAGTRVDRYLLNPNPDAFDSNQVGFENWRFITLARENATGGDSPFIFDIYIHGNLEEDSNWAVRIPRLDIRKFLHAPTSDFSDDPDLARLQSYFAEFSRKKKVIYPQTIPSDGTRSPLGERTATASLREALGPVREKVSALSAEGQIAAIKVFSELDSSSPRFGALDHNLRRIRTLTGGESRGREEWSQALIQAEGHLAELSALEKIGEIALTNNCREPGNFEIGLNDRLGRSLLHASFVISPEQYDQILESYQGFGIREQGTGVRIPNDIWRSDWRYAIHALDPRNYLKFLPRVDIETFSAAGPARASGSIQIREGAIPYPDSELEVQIKSGSALGQEPLAYVRIDPSLPMPLGFESPGRSSEPAAYWNSPENRGIVVPHFFHQFEDLQKYDVLLSGFEPNGVYVGRSDLQIYDEEREEGRWPFDLSHLASLGEYEVREDENGSLEIRLLSKAGPSDAVNFVFGNLQLQRGESALYLLGMATQPLAASYDEDIAERPRRYAFAYGSDGTILDHHDTAIGVERVWITHTQEGDLRVQLISHERILPLWEGTLRTSEAGADGSE